MTEQPSGGHQPRIVVGVDGSASSEQALRWALRQAELTGAAVEAVIAWHFHFISSSNAMMPAEIVAAATDFRKIAEQVLADTVSRVTSGGFPVPVTQEVLEGSAAAVLIRQSAGADLLVVGSRGYGGLAEALLGSVSQHCVHHAACPVVIVRGDVTTAGPTAAATPAQQPVH
jgi:nucleotide-binding universal stress UspA family protein